MIVIRLRGGLGNQMFQYALGKRIAKQLNTNIKLDLTSLLKTSKDKNVTNRDYQLGIFNIEESFLVQPNLLRALDKVGLNFISQFLKGIKLLGFKSYKERTYTVEDWLLKNPTDKTLYSGYWQSEAYFEAAEDELRKDFKFKGELSLQATKIQEKIESVNAVCIHMRRGDYVGNRMFNDLGLDYFKKSVDYIGERSNEPHFFVFSDDPKWCKENVNFDYDYTVVNYETEYVKYKEDLQLMASCKHFVMSASSFSWWAVWLSNRKDNIVIAPEPWFLNDAKDTRDLISQNWVRL